MFKIFSKFFGSKSVQTLEKTNHQVEQVVQSIVEQPRIINPTESLGAGIKKLREHFGICIEARPGYRRFRQETINGPVDTVVTSETTDRFVGYLGQSNLSNSTLTISRNIGEDAGAQIGMLGVNRNGFWHRDIGIIEFLGLRRDYVWGKDGLTKITSLQKTGTTLPLGTTRELKPSMYTRAYRYTDMPITEYPQRCPVMETTVLTKQAKTPRRVFRDDTQTVLQSHKDTVQLYGGARYEDKYADYRTPIWSI